MIKLFSTFLKKLFVLSKIVVPLYSDKAQQQNNKLKSLYTMTPYLIISTRNAFQQNGVHTMVFNHTIKTNLQDCIRWINLMNDIHGFTGCEKTFESEDGKLISYNAKFTTQEGERGWVEYEIWKEQDINM